jgi:ubiquinone/menaquinone biosynthesis C-methylase UbiE
LIKFIYIALILSLDNEILNKYIMNIIIPDKSLLYRTNEVDYYDWNYKFPVKYVQLYRFKTIVRILGDKKFPRLLEFGTGSGILLPELARHCEMLYACDVHPFMNKVQDLLRQYKIVNFEIKSQGIEKTDYPDNFFDVIVGVSVLEFVKDLEAAIFEIKRILKPNGFFVTICPMQNRILDFLVSLYAKKTAEEEFGDSRKYVTKELEKNFIIDKKGYMLPLIRRHFPVYTHYKLRK